MSKKNRRKIRKALATMLAALLLVVVSVGATIAYLQDSDNVVTNVFTTGKVEITLDEAWVNADGEPVDANGNVVEKLDDAKRVNGNSYKLFPGGSYTKDPTVHVSDVSEDAYLGVVVNFKGGAAVDSLGLNMLSIFQTIDVDNWEIREKQVSGNDVTYVLVYEPVIEAEQDIVLFETLKVPADLANEDVAKLNEVEMVITAYAIQEDGFEKAAEALEAGWSEIF